MTTAKPKSSVSIASIFEKLLQVGVITLLLLSWVVLFRLIVVETDLLLPYDVSWYDYWGWPQDGPAPGSWQRGLNYFFESPVGSILPAMLVVGISVFLYVSARFCIPQSQEKAMLLTLSFAVSNLISVPIILLISYVVVGLFSRRPTGWTRTLMICLPILFLLILLFALQVRIASKKIRP